MPSEPAQAHGFYAFAAPRRSAPPPLAEKAPRRGSGAGRQALAAGEALRAAAQAAAPPAVLSFFDRNARDRVFLPPSSVWKTEKFFPPTPQRRPCRYGAPARTPLIQRQCREVIAQFS